MTPLFGGGKGAERESRDRSAEDRERAWAEREARRAAREGRAPAAPPPPARDPEPPAHVEPEPPAYVEPELPTRVEPEPAAYVEPEPPTYVEPEPPAYVEPEPPAHVAPESPAHVAPESPAHVAPDPPAYVEPEPPAYVEPEPPAHVEPDPPTYAEPEPPAYVEPDPPAYADQETVAYTLPEHEHGAQAVPVPPADADPAAEADAVPQPDVHDDDHGPELAAYDPAEPSVIVHGRSDEPAGLKRVKGSPMASAAGAESPPRFGAPPRGTPRGKRRGRRGIRRIAAVVLLLVVAAVAVFLVRLYQPGKGAGNGRVSLKVPAGASAAQIGDLLAAKHVVASSFFFGLRARISGQRADLRSGDYVLRRDMSYADALAALTKAPPAAPALAKLTIPEGPSRREVAPLVAKAGLKGSYLTASKSSSALNPRTFGAPKAATLEGFLFPATYDLKPNATAASLVSQQLRAFRRNFTQVDLKAAKRKNLSRFDVVTIASMVEREAEVPKDRRLIAGVIYNRLKQGMPLGIDATIRYELGNFSRPLKVSELKRNTPYNTRTRTGLPPGPIGNPGLASLQAAANPAKNSYLFYVVKPCGNGAHAFSSTDAQFQKDVAAYNAKRAQLGGKDPSRC